MSRNDLLTPLGIFLGISIIFGAIYVAAGYEGLLGFLNLPSFITVAGGLIASIFVGFGPREVKNTFAVLHTAFRRKEVDITEFIEYFVRLSRQSKTEGMIAGLDKELDRIKDPFVKKGLSLVIDGYDPELIRQIMQMEIDALQNRHFKGQTLIRRAGELSPGWGMIGTIVGLVLMLQRLNDPSSIGPAIALALITTFYGILLANLVFNPIANKLVLLSEEEVFLKRVIVEALISIRKEEGPAVLRQKLHMFLSNEMHDSLKRLEEGVRLHGEKEFTI
ncbi:flagellar motor protein MotP [Bacillaceae bacterium]